MLMPHVSHETYTINISEPHYELILCLGEVETAAQILIESLQLIFGRQKLSGRTRQRGMSQSVLTSTRK